MTLSPAPRPLEDVAADVDAVITGRHSVRRFLPEPVAPEVVEAILDVAARSPSGSNTQPWRVHVLMGEPLSGLSQAILAVYNDPSQAGQAMVEAGYYPDTWFEPYQARRKALGLALYQTLGIGKADREAMHTQQGRNYRFFDAPVGLIFTIDRRLGLGSWLDCGMFMQSVMLAAKARGLDTCAQAAFNPFHALIAQRLALPEHERVVCGMALGHADTQAVENTLVSAREPVSSFARFWT
jgi:nitroreductase